MCVASGFVVVAGVEVFFVAGEAVACEVCFVGELLAHLALVVLSGDVHGLEDTSEGFPRERVFAQLRCSRALFNLDDLRFGSVVV